MKSGSTVDEGPASPASDAPASDLGDLRTRQRVARLLLERGPQTATALSEALDLSPAAVRRHLEALTTDGSVTSREQRPTSQRGRGRPARVFLLTDRGREGFPHAYDDLALQALRYLRARDGEQALDDFARRRLEVLERKYRQAVRDAEPPGDPIAAVSAVAAALTAEGYAASVTELPTGSQICQHHCPVGHVAAEFPQLCEAETELIGEMLGTHVQRLATIAHGDGVCTTHVPAPGNHPLAPSAGQSGRTA